MRDYKGQAIVLKRTNYGEADRILQLITEEGKFSVLAKGVRKERSKLAGGIELFSLSEIVIHHGKGDLGVLTGARLIEFYSAICSDLGAMEFAGSCLRDVAKRSEHIDSPDYFGLLAQTLKEVNRHLDKIELVQVWWLLNLARISGEDVNLRVDTSGNKLQSDKTYVWNSADSALELSNGHGNITSDHIKLMRLIVSAPLALVLNVQNTGPLTGDILYVAKCFGQI